MRILTLLALFSMMTLSACGYSGGYVKRDISDLKLPKARVIEGKVSKIDGDEFVLTDASGKIPVDVELKKGQKLGLKNGQQVKVYGNLDGDGEEFDAYAIETKDGKMQVFSDKFKKKGCCSACKKEKEARKPCCPGYTKPKAVEAIKKDWSGNN